MTSVVQRRKTDIAPEDGRRHRLYNPETGKYLNGNATRDTDDPFDMWLGFRRQAEVLAQRAKARGDHWPYVFVRREAEKREPAFLTKGKN